VDASAAAPRPIRPRGPGARSAPPGPLSRRLPAEAEGAAPQTHHPLQAVDLASGTTRNETRLARGRAAAAALAASGPPSSSVELDASFLRQKQAASGGRRLLPDGLRPHRDLTGSSSTSGGGAPTSTRRRLAAERGALPPRCDPEQRHPSRSSRPTTATKARGPQGSEAASVKQGRGGEPRAADERHLRGVATIADV